MKNSTFIILWFFIVVISWIIFASGFIFDWRVIFFVDIRTMKLWLFVISPILIGIFWYFVLLFLKILLKQHLKHTEEEK